MASTELARIADRLDAAYPRPLRAGTGVRPRRGWYVKSITDLDRERDLLVRTGLVIIGLVALVLVVACTNLSNLVLARGAIRRHEIAVRRALGASRWRLVREQLAETTLIAVLGGVAGFIVLRVMMTVLNLEVPTGPSTMVSIQPRVNMPALVAAGGALMLALLVFGLEPALRLTRQTDVRGDLAAGSAGVGAPPNAARHRQLLRWQVAISAGFFIIATLSIRFLATDARHDPGIEMDGLAVAVVSFYSQGWDEAKARRAVDRIVEQGRSSPDVEAVAVSTGLPFGVTITPGAEISTPDKPSLPNGQYESAALMAVTSDYFEAVNTPLLHGSGIEDRDSAGSPSVIVLSRSAALRLFGTSDALNREVLLKVETRGWRANEVPRVATVVGIAADVDTGRYGTRRDHSAYVPFAQEYLPMVTVVARSTQRGSAVPLLRQLIRNADPDVAIERIDNAYAVLAGPFAYLRAAGITSVALGGLTLVLAMVGLYGIQAHGVAHRTREIGVRMSLGATARQVRTMILKDGYTPVLQGLAIGLVIGVAGRAVVRAALSEKLDIIDPWMLMIVPVPLLLAAFCACYLPARRASRVDPSVALRDL